jgi:hypothetical protein
MVTRHMFKFNLLFWVLLGSLLISAAPCRAGAQRDAVCGGGCGGGCGPCSGSGRGNSRDAGPSADDLREEAADQIDDLGRAAMARGDYEQALEYFNQAYDQSQQERHAKYYRNDKAWARGAIANRNGSAAADRGDFATALSFFEEALRQVPDAKEYQEQVAWVKGAIFDEQAKSARSKGDSRTALKFYRLALETLPHPSPEYRKYVEDLEKKVERQDEIAKVFDHLAAASNDYRAAKSASDLAFTATEAGTETTPGSSALDFMPEEGAAQTGAGKGTFGTTIAAAHPDLGGAPITPKTVSTNVELLSSVSKSGQDAKNARSIEEAKAKAGCGFDGAPCREPDHIEFVKTAVQTPASMELLSHIPEGARKDEALLKDLAWYDNFEKIQAGKALEIAQLQNQIASGKGDTAVLTARKAGLEFENRQVQADQAKAKDRIRKRVRDLSMAWIETPQQTGPAGAPAPTQPDTKAAE